MSISPLGNTVNMWRVTVGLWDVAAWFLATIALAGARYDFDLADVQWGATLRYAAVASVLMLVVGFSLGLYRGHYRVGSFQEAYRLSTAVLAVSVVVGVGFLVGVEAFPVMLAAAVPPAVMLFSAAGRWIARAYLERSSTPSATTTSEPTLIYGAGLLGGQIGMSIRSSREQALRVVGYLDDDPGKRHLHLEGGRVVGRGADLEEAARRTGATTVVLAITAADEAFVRGLTARTDAAGLRLLVMPPLEEIVRSGYSVRLSQLHEVRVEDLLGRRPVQTDLGAIADYISGRVVLITGAGGSIGSELARQVHKFGPKELVLLDRDESGLHAVQLSIYGTGLLDTPDMVLADIREADVVDRVFAEHRPDVVFHAAALKHLPMLEKHPDEGWKTNVLGTLNVLEAAQRHGVERFVNISTDKAADASSVLGKTKRVAEELTAWFAEAGAGAGAGAGFGSGGGGGRGAGAGAYLSVRFGNVLGSRGSVLHAFRSQIERGGPVTVTHPEVTRYFMTIPEACELVIQAGAIGDPGDVLVLDMGTPIAIVDVARRLIAQSGKDVEIVFTGLRPGEKLHEALFSDGEDRQASSHPLISHVQVPPLDPRDVRGDVRTLVSAPWGELAG